MITSTAFRACVHGIIVGFSFIPPIAFSCSCGTGSLKSMFERSDNIFTAVITGGTITGERVGNSPKLQTTFEVTESFKGTIPFDHFNSHADSNSCGTSLPVGVEYLIFAPDSGDIGLCSGIFPVSGVSDMGKLVGRAYVDALRSFASGKKDLSEPWFFHSTAEVCRLSVGFSYGDRRFPAYLRAIYRNRPPENAVAEPDQPQFQPGFVELTIRVPGRDDLSNFPMSLSLGDEDYVAYWRNERYSSGRYFLQGDDVTKIIAALEHAEALHIRSAHPNHGEINAKASMSNAGDSITRMLGCMTRD